MKERPILFSATMVRAILNGSKTQTRRVVKHSLHPDCFEYFKRDDGLHGLRDRFGRFMQAFPCPYGQPGDQLWVREAFSYAAIHGYDKREDGGKVWYRATDENVVDGPWKPSIHMPRWASRIQLEITGIRVERLQDISEADAQAEGVERMLGEPGYKIYGHPFSAIIKALDAQTSYRSLWESINGAGSWDENPWVWVVEFKRLKP